MNDEALAWNLLVELEAQRRREPDRASLAGQIDITTFLGRCQCPMEMYLQVAQNLRSRDLIGEPPIDQLSIDNGGIYITGLGTAHLGELRMAMFSRLGNSFPVVSDVATDIIKKAWPAFEKSGKWPEFKTIEKRLILDLPPKSDVFQAIQQIPRWVGNVQVGAANSPIYIRLLGIVACVGSDSAVVLEEFWRAFTLARFLFHDSSDEIDVKLTSNDLGGSGRDRTLGMATKTLIRQAWYLLDTERLLSGGGMTDNDERYDWSYSVAARVHDFQDTPTLEDYLLSRLAEDAPAPQDARVASHIVQPPPPDPRKVFVIHGRDSEARAAVFGFLRALDLHPLEWEELVASTGQATPYTGEVVAKAFAEAQAVIALLTPDDEVRLHQSLWGDEEEESEKEFQGQPRPNVYFEAGMAFNAQPDRTLIVEIGRIKTASDLHGRNVVRFHAAAIDKSILALYQRLEHAGCAVNQSNASWMDTSRFANLAAHTRHKTALSGGPGALPTGTILQTAPAASKAGLRAKLFNRGSGSYLLEVMNSGSVALRDVQWSIKESAPNWSILANALPRYPIPELPPREYVRLPVAVSMGGPSMVELHLTAVTPEGKNVEAKSLLSVYG
jgi:predicted nucleotide-binding protein